MTQQPSLRKSITIAAVIMTGSVLLSRVLGLARDLVLARSAGTGSDMDAYVAAFLLPELVNHVLAEGFLAITFIPIYQRYLTTSDPGKAQRVFCNLLCVGTLALVPLLIVCGIFTDNLLLAIEGLKQHPATARDAEWVALTTRLTRIILPAQVFIYWGAFFMAVQYAHQRFLIPALMPICYNLGIILGGICLGPWLGIEGFAWGVLAGAFVGGVLVQLAGVLRLGIRFRLVVDLRDPDLYKYIALSLPFVVGLSMTFSNEFLFRFFGLFLNQGAISSLNYALRVMMMVVGIFGLAIAAASYPFLSRLAAEGRNREMGELASNIIRKTCALVFPISAVMAVLAPEVLCVLFERGEFTAASTQATAPVLQMYLVGAFAFAASAIVMRCFYALQNTLLPMVVSTTVVILSLPAYWFLGRSLGSPGIGLAASLGVIAQFAVMLALWSARPDNGGAVRAILGAIARIAVAAAAAGLVCACVRGALTTAGMHLHTRFLTSLAIAVFAGLPALIAAVVALELLRVQRVRETIRLFRRK